MPALHTLWQRSLQLIALSALVLVAALHPVRADDKVAVGVLRYVSSGGLFLAAERGYFKAEGIDIEMKFFDAAQPIAVAVVSGDTQFGVTALTAGFYNLAGKGALKIIGAQAKEAKGFEGNAILASIIAYKKGFTDISKFPGHSLGITQAGSSFHYQIGQIAKAKGFELKSVDIKPLQSLPNMVAALSSGQVDSIIIAPHLAKPLIASGSAHLLGWYSDIDEYQFGALFTGTKTDTGNKPLVERFVRAYQKGMADYADAFLRRGADGKLLRDGKTDDAAKTIAKQVYPGEAEATAVPKVIESVFAVDPKAKLDVEDIVRQVQWMKEQNLVEPAVDARAIVDLSFVQ